QFVNERGEQPAVQWPSGGTEIDGEVDAGSSSADVEQPGVLQRAFVGLGLRERAAIRHAFNDRSDRRPGAHVDPDVGGRHLARGKGARVDDEIEAPAFSLELAYSQRRT